MPKSNELQIQYLNPHELNDYHRQLHTPNKQIEKTKELINYAGLVTPVIIDNDDIVIIGWHLVEAARQLNIDEIPVIRITHLDETQLRVLRVAYERIAEEADWDKKALAAEFSELEVLLPDLTILGFELDELNIILDIETINDGNDHAPNVEDGPAITQLGDVYILGDHRLYCGDALKEESYQTLLDGEQAQMGFTDSPYNVCVNGHVGNSGKTKHREFVQGSGELSPDEFTVFQTTFHQHMAKYSESGAVIFSCMDWRHMQEMLSAAEAAKLDMINLCCWVKDNGGMGSLYRSRHELVFVFKNGKGKHVNNVQLGSNGRYRTNVWEYPGVNSFGSGRMDELHMHPTVKPVAMVADAIKDCSKRGGIILDPFGGSGTTLIAAEQTGRKARLIELDPLYCDVTIRRWQDLTGKDAIHAETGRTFNETQAEQGE